MVGVLRGIIDGKDWEDKSQVQFDAGESKTYLRANRASSFRLTAERVQSV